VRALVIGYGSIARRHLDNLRALGAARECIVFRPAGCPADAPADLRFVASLGEGIAAKPDCAVVASPSARHMESLEPLLAAGVACYVEKPAVTTTGDVEKLRALLGHAKPPVTLSGCNLRFLPSLRRLREELRSGKIGTPVRASLQAGQWLPDWRPQRDYRKTYSASAAQGGGVIFDLIHEIDAARWLFGEFDEVRALSGRLSRLEIDAEDTACILLGKRSGGPIVSIGLDYVSRQRIRRYEVVGDEGTLLWDLAIPRLSLIRAAGEETLDAEPASFDVAATYLTAMREFVDAVRDRRPTSQDLVDGLATTDLALRAK
jgi:predicted dehydrogenase